MSLGRVRKPARRETYGTTERDVEKKRTRLYFICALIILACIILDVLFFIGIFSV
ncbi:MAG: hypothetical protein K6E72_07275 [Saccharofermentans sp.]|nr:hypothetical protein [Clostridiales bacterium]MCR5384415.1 hypothetical protein [Saccharofermentans sp.]